MVDQIINEHLVRFEQDGYVLVPGLLDNEEVSLLQEAVRSDQQLLSAAMDVKDSSGRRTNLSLWNHPGEDIYGMIARSEKIAGIMAQLLQDEVYHYHSKLSAKQPKVGGAWEWHQDYGYWYQNNCLFPDMASVLIAVDPNTRENGCLEVLKGSHKAGRISHGLTGEQTGADVERVEELKKLHEHVYCELAPGDGLYFHANLLHASSPNASDHPRWSLLCCYNTRHNDPYKTSHHPDYTPLETVPHSAIKNIGAKGSSVGQEFLKQESDDTTG